MAKNKLLLLLLFLFLVKSLAWLWFIPIFQSPDEPYHYGFIQYLGENLQRPHPRRGSVISQETVEISQIVNFNWEIIHPVWQGYQVDWQEKINSINKDSQENFVVHEQRTIKNPPFYYWLGYPFYKIFNNSNFIFRFYSIRFLSLILGLLTVWFSYQAGLFLFKKQLQALTLACLVGFQPMFSFISGVVNNDSAAILSATMFTFFSLKAIKKRNNKFILLALLSVILGMLVKPMMLIFLLFFPLILGKKFFQKALLFLGILILLLAGIYFIKPEYLLNSVRYSISLADYQEIFNFLLQFGFWGNLGNYWQENKLTFTDNLFPWFWGVFGWLEKTMPLSVYRILKIICLFSGIGLIFWFIKNGPSNRKKDKKIILFLLLLIIIYVLGIIFFDFKVFSTTGNLFGLQGRYFLPLILPLMILILQGLLSLVPKNLQKFLCYLLIFGSIALNIIGFWSMYSYFWL